MFHLSKDTAGCTLGPLISLAFLYCYSGHYKKFFLLAFIPGIISLFFIFLVKEKKQQVSSLGKGNFSSSFKYWKIATPEYKNLEIVLFLIFIFNSSVYFLLLKL